MMGTPALQSRGEEEAGQALLASPGGDGVEVGRHDTLTPVLRLQVEQVPLDMVMANRDDIEAQDVYTGWYTREEIDMTKESMLLFTTHSTVNLLDIDGVLAAPVGDAVTLVAPTGVYASVQKLASGQLEIFIHLARK